MKLPAVSPRRPQQPVWLQSSSPLSGWPGPQRQNGLPGDGATRGPASKPDLSSATCPDLWPPRPSSASPLKHLQGIISDAGDAQNPEIDQNAIYIYMYINIYCYILYYYILLFNIIYILLYTIIATIVFRLPPFWHPPPSNCHHLHALTSTGFCYPLLLFTVLQYLLPVYHHFVQPPCLWPSRNCQAKTTRPQVLPTL